MWREQLYPASYRGVPFAVTAHNRSGGRRLAVHEFPGVDRPQCEDLGQKTREIAIEAFLLGPDYIAQRDRLIRALEVPGAAELVHPWLGAMRVVVRDWRQSETIAEGGLCRLSLTFIDAEGVSPSMVEPDLAAAVESAAIAVQTAAASSVAATTPVTLAALVDQLIAQLDGSLSALQDLAAAARSAVNAVTSRIRAVCAALRNIRATLGQLLAIPARAAEQFKAVLADLFASLGESGEARARTALMLMGAVLPVPGMPDMVRRINVQLAAGCLAAAASSMSAASYACEADLRAQHAQFLDALDTLAEQADDAVYAGLLDLSAALTRQLTNQTLALPQLVRYTPQACLPALVIAFEQLGDAARDGEVIARNAIRHPGFVPGGIPLELIDD